MSVQPEFVNYNVKTAGWSGEHWDWCDEQGIPFRVFVNYDGGGYNHHVVEFTELGHARDFISHFSITGGRCLYAEDADGHIHYLDGNRQPEGGAQ